MPYTETSNIVPEHGKQKPRRSFDFAPPPENLCPKGLPEISSGTIIGALSFRVLFGSRAADSPRRRLSKKRNDGLMANARRKVLNEECLQSLKQHCWPPAERVALNCKCRCRRRFSWQKHKVVLWLPACLLAVAVGPAGKQTGRRAGG